MPNITFKSSKRTSLLFLGVVLIVMLLVNYWSDFTPAVLVMTGGTLLVLSAVEISHYAEVECTREWIVFRRPYNVFTREHKIAVGATRSVRLVGVKGIALRFEQQDGRAFAIAFSLFTQRDMQAFAAFLHENGIQTTGF